MTSAKPSAGGLVWAALSGRGEQLHSIDGFAQAFEGELIAAKMRDGHSAIADRAIWADLLHKGAERHSTNAGAGTERGRLIKEKDRGIHSPFHRQLVNLRGRANGLGRDCHRHISLIGQRLLISRSWNDLATTQRRVFAVPAFHRPTPTRPAGEAQS